MPILRHFLFLFIGLTVFPSASFASFGIVSECTAITPATDGEIFILSQNLRLKGEAKDCLQISKANITLDCQGHSIEGKISAQSTTGIKLENGNITVKNCTITGFHSGIALGMESPSSLAYEKIVLEGNVLEKNHRGISYAHQPGPLEQAVILKTNTIRDNQTGLYIESENTQAFVSNGKLLFDLNDNVICDNGDGEESTDLDYEIAVPESMIDLANRRNDNLYQRISFKGSNNQIGNKNLILSLWDKKNQAYYDFPFPSTLEYQDCAN